MTRKIKTERSSQGLIDTMFEELDLLKNGKSTPQMARAKSAVVSSIMSMKRLEMDAVRFIAHGQEIREIKTISFNES